MSEAPVQTFYPSREISRNARIKNMCEYQDLRLEAEENTEAFWDRMAKEHITWMKPYSKVLDESNAPFYKWFTGGKLNVTHQCLDRHLKDRKNKAAIIFEGEPGDKRVLTYLELWYEVNKAANLLKNKFHIQRVIALSSTCR